jgi:hypothetical protein
MIISRRMRWAEHVAHMGEMKNAHNILLRPRHKLEDNIRMDLRERGCEAVEQICLTEIGTSEQGNGPLGSINSKELLG